MTMEQEQTIDFAKWMYDYKADINKVEECFEQYYNETYNQIAKNIYTVIVFMSDKDIDWNQKRCYHDWKSTTLIISVVYDCKKCGVKKEDYDNWKG
jgi:hypothetical protein